MSPDILTDGRWVNDRGIKRWVPDPPQSEPERRSKPGRKITYHTPPIFTADERRRAHTAYARGDRGPWARVGEREYKREQKRAWRARRAAA